MKALLVRVGVDQAYGAWNAPVDVDGLFVYVPIPEKIGTLFRPGLTRSYEELRPKLDEFCAARDRDLAADLKFPKSLLDHPMHLDPDFEQLSHRASSSRNLSTTNRSASSIFLKVSFVTLIMLPCGSALPAGSRVSRQPGFPSFGYFPVR